jgi:hypothetical protein
MIQIATKCISLSDIRAKTKAFQVVNDEGALCNQVLFLRLSTLHSAIRKSLYPAYHHLYYNFQHPLLGGHHFHVSIASGHWQAPISGYL